MAANKFVRWVYKRTPALEPKQPKSQRKRNNENGGARKKQFAFAGANKQASKLAKKQSKRGAQNKLDKPAGRLVMMGIKGKGGAREIGGKIWQWFWLKGYNIRLAGFPSFLFIRFFYLFTFFFALHNWVWKLG